MYAPRITHHVSRTPHPSPFIPRPSPLTPSSGSVFILALWALFFLGALALAVGALVSANINLASSLRARMVARELARAGVELAIGEVVGHSTNWDHKVWQKVEKGEEDPPNDEVLFKDNDSLEGGAFTVTYAYLSPGSEQMVTNHGVLCESQKAGINRSNSRQLKSELMERAGLSEMWAEHLAAAIVACRKKADAGLTEGGGSNYAAGSIGEYRCHGGSFRVLFELLLLKEFRDDPELFGQLEPHLTVHGKESFSGTSTGRALALKGFRWSTEKTVLAESKIDFVVNKNGEIEYWHEQ